MFPTWARDNPDRLLYLSNAGGKFEVYAWDERTGGKRQVTDRSEGTGYRVSSQLDPRGEWIWWFDDEKGNELGRWVREPWSGGPRETMAPQLPPSYSGRIAIAQYQFTLQSDDLELLNTWAPRLVRTMREMPELRDVSSDQQNRGLEVPVTIDRATAENGIEILREVFDQVEAERLWERS